MCRKSLTPTHREKGWDKNEITEKGIDGKTIPKRRLRGEWCQGSLKGERAGSGKERTVGIAGLGAKGNDSGGHRGVCR